MSSVNRVFSKLFPVMMGTAVLVLGSSRAWAIYDMGFGFGFGMGMVPSVTGYLNDHALVGAARGMQGVPSRTPLAGNPNSFHNRLRDDGFVSHRDVRRRQPPTYRSEPVASLGNRQVQQPQAAATPPQPDLPLVSFFDPERRLVWPGESPVSGDLKGLRNISDEASLAVLDDTKHTGTASITLVTIARERLLDYGRPALREIRATATPRIADSFHLFMLSLYESLAQAALPR
jgi:hypothetical protein